MHDSLGTSGTDLLMLPVIASRVVKKGVQMRHMGVSTGRWIKAILPGEYTVLVSDLSGFTRVTKKHGIVHTASVILRMRQLCMPILKKYGVEEVETEADNFICLFPDPVKAVRAALEMKHVLEVYADQLPEDRKHFAPNLGGIGLDVGDGVVMDRWCKFHGEAVERAYEIGEDMCEGGDVLISMKLKKAIVKMGGRHEMDGVTFETFDEEQGIHRVLADLGADAVDIISSDNGEHFDNEELLLLTRRHDPSVDLEAHDAALSTKYLRPKAALMFKLDFGEHTDTFGMKEELESKSAVLDELGTVFVKYGGVAVEDFFIVFDTAEAAVTAAVCARRRLDEYNFMQHNPAEVVQGGGWGVHVGKMIFVPHTDVHWGDPVNTASKLGQDVAQDGDLMVSEEALKSCDKKSAVLQFCSYLPRQVTVSKVSIKAFSIRDSKLAHRDGGHAPTTNPEGFCCIM